jgi:hypothetical protein
MHLSPDAMADLDRVPTGCDCSRTALPLPVRPNQNVARHPSTGARMI